MRPATVAAPKKEVHGFEKRETQSVGKQKNGNLVAASTIAIAKKIVCNTNRSNDNEKNQSTIAKTTNGRIVHDNSNLDIDVLDSY